MKRKYLLSFSESAGNKPVICEVIKRHAVSINIINAELSPGMTGSMLAEFIASDEDMKLALEFLKVQGVETALVTNKITIRMDECLHCGSCAAACFPKALTIGAPDWRLSINMDNCILCRLCLTACPRKLFSITADLL